MEEYTNIFRIGEIAFSVIFMAFAIAWLIRGAINKKSEQKAYFDFYSADCCGLVYAWFGGLFWEEVCLRKTIKDKGGHYGKVRLYSKNM